MILSPIRLHRFARKTNTPLVNEEMKKFVADHIPEGCHPDHLTIKRLFGQASTRQYYRVTITQQIKNTQQPTYVVMKLPQGFSSLAEEVTKTEESAPKEFPFLNVQKHLANLGIPVPKVFGTNPEKGFILLEDLGDKTVDKLIQGASDEFLLFYYKKIIDTLIDMQLKTAQNASHDCVASYRKFDENLLNWEFLHFLEYGIEDRKKIKLPETEKDVFKKTTEWISKEITKMPQGFVHRDFQSRNIIFKDYNFYLIDFQDALMGPVLYDLVACLRDSYLNITPKQLDTLLEYYIKKLPDSHPYKAKSERTKSDFHLITLQRKLKDAGRFQYILTQKGNPDFIKHVPQSLEYVKQALHELHENKTVGALQEFLSRHLEEFA